jgi:putative ABC transport system substrate-binding protein
MSMRRREFLTLLGGAAAAWPIAGRAQQGALPVIGFLGSSAPLNQDTLAAFRTGLNDVGYVEGKNVTIDVRAAERYDQLPALAADFVRGRVSVIVPSALPAALAAKAATTTIPIVFFSGADPVASGLVTSLSRPTGNLTGVTNLNTTLLLKRLELLHEFAPAARDIAVLHNGANPVAETAAEDIQAAAKGLGVQVRTLYASTEEEIAAAFAQLGRLQVRALVIDNDQFFATRQKYLADLATAHAVPMISFRADFVRSGGLASYSSPPSETFRQVGVYAGRILKGEKPADLPVMQPTKFELSINMKTAKALGLNVPPILQAIADEVIE